ncbi:unnamed protein product, partial [Ectocarpus sp. 12 AP-2014]
APDPYVYNFPHSLKCDKLHVGASILKDNEVSADATRTSKYDPQQFFLPTASCAGSHRRPKYLLPALYRTAAMKPPTYSTSAVLLWKSTSHVSASSFLDFLVCDTPI